MSEFSVVDGQFGLEIIGDIMTIKTKAGVIN